MLGKVTQTSIIIIYILSIAYAPMAAYDRVYCRAS